MSSQTQTWDPKSYQAKAGFVAELGRPVLALLEARAGERVLDLGCGDGVLTRAIVGLGCEVVGVDASEQMVDAARSAGIEAYLGDAAALTFVEEFDAVFSNAALHWIRPPRAVVAGVWRALKPGGRFVGEFGGSGNVAAIVTAIETALARRGVTAASPWYFPTPAEYSVLLEAAGFVVKSMELFPRPTPLPGDIRGWLETFAQPYVAALPEAERETLTAEIVESLRGILSDASGNWHADYVRLRFSARKP